MSTNDRFILVKVGPAKYITMEQHSKLEMIRIIRKMINEKS